MNSQNITQKYTHALLTLMILVESTGHERIFFASVGTLKHDRSTELRGLWRWEKMM